jgi:hypothetical protein
MVPIAHAIGLSGHVTRQLLISQKMSTELLMAQQVTICDWDEKNLNPGVGWRSLQPFHTQKIFGKLSKVAVLYRGNFRETLSRFSEVVHTCPESSGGTVIP